MRIVAGRFRRRVLETRPGMVTRPISNLVKESLFEQIQHLLDGRRIADIFAGTGTIGLEAMSRGAVSGIFIEQDEIAFELLRKNIATLKVEDSTFCWQTDVFRCSFRPKNVDHLLPCDLLFFDPPFKMVQKTLPGTPLFKSLERMARGEFSSPEAILIFRVPERTEFQVPAVWMPYEPLPHLSFSAMDIYLYQKQKAEEGGESPDEGFGTDDSRLTP